MGRGQDPDQDPEQDAGQNPRSLGQRLLWFAALWLGGVGTLAVLSLGLRLWLAPK
jgi:hypothetical protein